MTDKYKLDEKRNPVKCDNLDDWAQWFEEPSNRRVDETRISDTVTVSTIFLGLDHGWGLGKPLLFETIIFGGPKDGYQDRCSTWKQAEEMHHNAVEIATLAGNKKK